MPASPPGSSAPRPIDESEQPLDRFDPRFADTEEGPGDSVRPRVKVRSTGPGASHDDPKVRILRVAVPLLAIAGMIVIGLVFYSGLRTGSTTVVLGVEADLRSAVADQPRRVCLNDNNPCAWLTVAGESLVAFNTNGPLPEEYGRQGVGWCPSSGYFGANATGSRWDQQGRLVGGPSIRSLDRFTLTDDARGNIVIDFASLTAGRADWMEQDVSAPSGPDCAEIPFDRAPDLDLTAIRQN